MATRDEQLEFVAREQDPRARADRLVVALLDRAGRTTTRAEVQRWMDAERVLVDGEPIGRDKAVAAGAVIIVRPAPPLRTAARPDPSVPFTLVYEDEHLLIVDKPAGIVVHPARGHWEGTLVHGLLALPPGRFDGPEVADDVAAAAVWPADPRDPHGHLRPGIVHRLDKDTSGLLVIAKTAATREALKERFAHHDIERSYTALVVGRAQQATYDTLYGRDPRSRIRFTSRLPAGRPRSRRAVTHVEPIEQWAEAGCVRCRLETGRTHQIRVHLAEQAGTPVLADPVYGRARGSSALQQIAAVLGRQALHATTLGFDHPASGKAVRWRSPLPEDFRQAMRALAAQQLTTPST